MNERAVLAGAMVLAGAVLEAPGLYLVAAVTVAYGALTHLWSSYGIGRVEYRRRFTVDRAVAGDAVGLDVTIWNRKPLPLPWIGADDPVTDGIAVREQPVLDRDNERIGRRILRNAWALAWYERVVRHYHLDAARRGVFEFGPARLQVRDILGRDAVADEVSGTQTLVVAPRTLPVSTRGRDAAPIGERRARRSLYADPALFGGVRPFQPGDSLRQVHWRATARLGRPVSRRYEPARGREVVIVLDVQTLDGPHWEMTYDDELFEGLCVAAGSLARSQLAGGASCGIAAASFTGTTQTIAFLAPQAAHGQTARIAGMLARIGPVSSRPFSGLLTWLTRRVAPGTTLLTLSARQPASFLTALSRMARSGYAIEHHAFGPSGPIHAAAVRRAGLRATAATLDPDWERADALVLAG